MPLILQERSARAKGSLIGLSVGDVFGDQFFLLDDRDVSAETGTPPAPWFWSDDTEMTCSVADALNQAGQINQHELIRACALVGGDTVGAGVSPPLSGNGVGCQASLSVSWGGARSG